MIYRKNPTTLTLLISYESITSLTPTTNSELQSTDNNKQIIPKPKQKY